MNYYEHIAVASIPKKVLFFFYRWKKGQNTVSAYLARLTKKQRKDAINSPSTLDHFRLFCWFCIALGGHAMSSGNLPFVFSLIISTYARE